MSTPRKKIRNLFAASKPHEQSHREQASYEIDFVNFLAKRRDIEVKDAQELVNRSQQHFKGGWGGNEYRAFTEVALEAFRPLYDDVGQQELIETYRVHAVADFFRMLSYPIPNEAQFMPILSRLKSRSRVVMVDYGCGLAQRSIALGYRLLQCGLDVEINFVDIRRELHWEFLKYVCSIRGLRGNFIEVSAVVPEPALPAHDYCEVVSVLEHLPNPVSVVKRIYEAMLPNGLLLASVEDEIKEMMHVSHDLSAVREQLASLKLNAIGECSGATLFARS